MWISSIFRNAFRAVLSAVLPYQYVTKKVAVYFHKHASGGYGDVLVCTREWSHFQCCAFNLFLLYRSLNNLYTVRIFSRDHIKTRRKFFPPSENIIKIGRGAENGDQRVSLQSTRVASNISRSRDRCVLSVTPFILVDHHRRFRRKCYIYLQKAATFCVSAGIAQPV